MRKVKRVAYADPPYIGQAKKHYSKDPFYTGASEVDHAALIAQLETYDGWALSLSVRSLKQILALCPDDVRVAAWCKTDPQLHAGITPTDAWEPVIYRPCRKQRSYRRVVYDWHASSKRTGFLIPSKHIIGRKPDSFCFWMFDLLMLEPHDSFTDVFPGSGAVGRAWEKYQMQRPLPLDGTITLQQTTLAIA